MGDVLTLSHSQLEAWDKCPLAWRYAKIDRLPQAPSEHLALGTAFHAAAEADGRNWIARREHLPLEELRRIGSLALHAEVARADPHGLLDPILLGLYERLDDMIGRYIERVQPTFNPVRVEEAFTRPLDEGVAFTGRIDAVTDTPFGPEIVDFKTASSMKSWPVGAEHKKDQAAAYQWGASEMLGQEPLAVTFIVLTTETVEQRTTHRTGAQLATYLNGVLATAETIRRARATGEFPAKTGPLCGWCGFLGTCADGKAWLRARGRTPAVPMVDAAGKPVTRVDVAQKGRLG